jgi:transposase
MAVEHQIEHRMELLSRRRVSRVEVLEGPTERRRWPDDVKARIVAESLLPGARVCDVAAKYGLIARHLSQWRGLARQGKLVLPCADGPAFVPLVLEAAAAAASVLAGPIGEAGVIRIEISGAVLHVAADCSPDRAAALAAAWKRVL